MEGVQILNEFFVEGAILAPWFAIGMSCAVGGLVGILLSSLFERILKKAYAPFMVIFALCFAFGIGVSAFAPRESFHRYQVIINDEVNFNEFVDYYKIVDQDGLIYTVEVKDESMANLKE